MYQQSEVKISDSEWLILQVIWEKSPLYMGDIVYALKYTPWKKPTIQTMVARLAAKKIIGANKTTFAFLYYPIVTREDAVKMYTESFVERVYNGNAYELLSKMANEDYLTPRQKKAAKKLFA